MTNKLFEENVDDDTLKKTHRHWAATFFTKPKMEHLTDSSPVRYMIFGEEICPSTGKTHWQAYIEFYKPIRMSGVKNVFCDKTIHLGMRFKSRENARNYCKKDGKFVEYGYWISGQGFRSDIFDVAEKLKNGAKLGEIIEENPQMYCQYRNGIKDIAAHYAKKRIPKFRDLKVTLLTGPTRCGKTSSVINEHEDIFCIDGNKLKWFDGYDGEDVLLIDEYNNDIAITELLNLLDWKPLRLETKGSHTYANWTKVYITTNLKPDEIHSRAGNAHREALFKGRKIEIKSFWPEEN